MNEVLLTQIIAIATTVTLFISLMFCPYRTPEFKSYNKSRRLFMVALIILTMQYVVNMHFHFRERSVVYGVTSNLFFYIPASYIFMSGMLNLQRAGHLGKDKILLGIGTTVLSYALLTTGIFLKDGAYQTIFNIVCSIILFTNQTHFSVLLYKDYKHTKEKLDNFYAFPAEDHTQWMVHSNVLAIILFLMIPIVIFFTHALSIFGILFWFALIYYVACFSYFGNYVRLLEDSYEEDSTPQNTIENEQPVSATATNASAANTLQQRIEDWIKEEKFCDNDITIMKLAAEMETNRTTLSLHINSVIGVNFREWINTLRIGKAKTLIKANPRQSLEEVSSICGFTTRKYFDQVFTTYEGVTAAEWRKKNV